MPKSSSKRKKEKNADFKKTKLKVGKKKAVSDSFTDTSFKSKAISLPSQSISHDKSALLTNSRNVTFAELITQLKHYSPGTRKDALLGLRDLFHRHPHLLPLHLGVLVNTVVRLLIDDSSVVRKALQSFLGEFIPMLHARDIHPFLPLLIVYTCSAMTHILDDIREDALKFMDLWVAAGGQVVVNGFWDKIIPNYVSLLTSDSNATNNSKNASSMSFTASTSSSMITNSSSSNNSGSNQKVVANASTGKNAPGSLKAKCDVLESLAGFLQEGLGGEGGDKDPYWFLRNFLGTAHARKAFNTIRTQRGVHEDLNPKEKSGKSSKKRKAPSGNSSRNGRSVRKKTESEEDEDESDSDEESDESGSDSEEEEEDDSSSENAADNYNDNPESLSFDASPLISFNNSHRHHQPLATFPMHPTVSHSSLVQSIWGNLTRESSTGGQPQEDPSTQTNIAIKVFHQQGGASASGAGANMGVSGSGKTSGDQTSGIHGRLAQIKPLIATLHPLLLSVWLDTAPSVFSSTTTIHANHALTIVHLVLKIWGILWRAALARPKKKISAETEEEQALEREEIRWLDEFLQSLLKHVLIYFPFGKDTVGMIDSKVSAMLQEMNTTYCELTSLFMLGSGVGRIQLIRKEPASTSTSNTPSQDKKSKRHQAINDLKIKSSNRPSNKDNKKRQAAAAVSKSQATVGQESDYETEDEDEEFAEHDRARAAAGGRQDMIAVQVVTPPWADQVVEFVLDTLGWVNPEAALEDKEDDNESPKRSNAMSGLSTDFKSHHLIALLPTLWTLLNCLETQRREWVFEALMSFFDQAHVQSGSKRTIIQFLALVIKLQSHPHYTGSFTVNIPGGRSTGRKTLMGLAKKDRKEQVASIQKLSKLLEASLLKLPKLLWDLGTERIETSQTVLDLLAWVTVIAGESATVTEQGDNKTSGTTAAAIKEADRARFIKTMQSYMALFFCVTVAAPKGSDTTSTRTILGPFVKLPPALQRRAIEIVYYSGVVSSVPQTADEGDDDDSEDEDKKSRKKKGKKQGAKKLEPLLAAVKSCCQVDELSDETRLYIQETLRIK